jgi:TetR/AcrR family transcriptional regulator, transcriptional repressor for nem operon
MPRAKCFDRDEALRNAMKAFWAHGYEATSIQDLVDCMGINRGSLYDTFGDKHQLFISALDQYTDTSLSRMTELQKSGNASDILSEFLIAFMYRTLGDPEKRGCFVTNTTIERSTHDDECAERLRTYYGCLEQDLQALIKRGQSADDIASTRSASDLAAFFIGVMQGIRVMGKVRPEENFLRPMVEVAIATLKS